MTLARIATLQLRLPELPDGAAVNRMAAADRLLKAGFNPTSRAIRTAAGPRTEVLTLKHNLS